MFEYLKEMRMYLLIAWGSLQMRESHTKCVKVGKQGYGP